MKLHSISFFGLILTLIFGLLASITFAQVIQPQALNLSGFPTISPPTPAEVYQSNPDAAQSSNSNLLLIKSLEAAGLPTIQPPASLTVSEKGEVKIKNAVVFQISGSTIFIRTYWGDTFLRWTIRTDKKTEVLKRFGGIVNISDIAVGHVLNIDGILLSDSQSFNLNASAIRDFSLENENGTFSGRVINTDSVGNVVMITPDGNSVTLNFDSGATIKKGAVYLQPTQISVGDKVISVSGSYNAITKKMEVSNIELYQEQSIFIPQNFQGTLKNLSGATLPVTFTLNVNGKDYKVYLPETAPIMRKDRSATDLKRFVEGDIVRVYGAIRNTDLNTIDAELIRNLNL